MPDIWLTFLCVDIIVCIFMGNRGFSLELEKYIQFLF